jgi:hypothetical protein
MKEFVSRLNKKWLLHNSTITCFLNLVGSHRQKKFGWFTIAQKKDYVPTKL